MFVSFFLPNLFVPPLSQSSDFINNFFPLAVFTIVSCAQALFMLYIISRGGKQVFPEFGLIKIHVMDIIYALLFAVGLFVIYYMLIIFIGFLPQHIRQVLHEGHRWKLEKIELIPLLLIFCFITGYREEILFRSYLLTRCQQAGFPLPLALITGTIFFGLLHIYEGIVGVSFALLSGLYLSYIFIKKRNIHIIGLAHAFFNITALLLTIIEKEL
jgi:membrane protease YdiL (CAAX protease family)